MPRARAWSMYRTMPHSGSTTRPPRFRALPSALAVGRTYQRRAHLGCPIFRRHRREIRRAGDRLQGLPLSYAVERRLIEPPPARLGTRRGAGPRGARATSAFVVARAVSRRASSRVWHSVARAAAALPAAEAENAACMSSVCAPSVPRAERRSPTCRPRSREVARKR